MSYTINFTDPANGSFVIKEYTTDGPATPIAQTPLDSFAVVGHTSLILLGKGMAEYGDRIAGDIVHMLEHFAYSSPPVYPIEGQLWYKNDTKQLYVCTDPTNVTPIDRWTPMLAATIMADLDMGGYKIINLGDPTNAQDAVTLTYADTNYVNVSGDTMAGTLNMNSNALTNVPDPVNPQDAMTLAYASATYVPLAGGTMTGILTLSSDPVGVLDAATKQYVDGAISGSGLFVKLDGSNTPMTGYLTLNGAPPVNPYHAVPLTYLTSQLATKANLVHTQGASTINYTPEKAIGAPSYLFDGSLVPSTSVSYAITAVSTGAGGTFTIAGIHAAEFVAGYEFQVAGSTGNDGYWTVASATDGGVGPTVITVTATQTIPDGTADGNIVAIYPTVSAQGTLADLDEAIGNVQGDITSLSVGGRTMFQGDGTTGQWSTHMYTAETNKSTLTINGVKQYRHLRAVSTVTFFPTRTTSDNTGLAVGSYTFNVNADGTGAVVVTVNVASVPYTFGDLATSIGNSLSSLPAAPSAQRDRASLSFRNSVFYFYSNTQGTGTDIVITDVDLFSSITSAASTISNWSAPAGVGPTLAYKEGPSPLTAQPITAVTTGAGGTFTIVGDFTAPVGTQGAITIGGKVTVSGSTGNDGIYTVTNVVGGATTVVTVFETVADGTADGNLSAPNNVAALSTTNTVAFVTAPTGSDTVELAGS